MKMRNEQIFVASFLMFVNFASINASREVDQYAEYWEVLGVKAAASLKEIKAAYHSQLAHLTLEDSADARIMCLHRAYQELYTEGKKLDEIGNENYRRVKRAPFIQAPQVEVFCGIKKDDKANYQDFENQETYEKSLMRRCLDPRLQLQLAIKDIVVHETALAILNKNAATVFSSPVFYAESALQNQSTVMQSLTGQLKIIAAFSSAQNMFKNYNADLSFIRVKESINAKYQKDIDAMMVGRVVNVNGNFDLNDYGKFHRQLEVVYTLRTPRPEKYPDLYKKLFIAIEQAVDLHNQLKQAVQNHA